jgi:hypothetical protein
MSARAAGGRPASIAAAMLAARTACIDLSAPMRVVAGPGGALTQNTAFRILDAGPATRSTAIDADVKLGVIR